MFKKFAGGDTAESWPLSKVVGALKKTYSGADLLGEDGPLKVYGVEDRGVNFVVAVLQSAASSGKVIEIGFLARFVGFPATHQAIETLNRNLHISVAAIEGAELYLMAGLAVTGAFEEGKFTLMLEAWRRDVMLTLSALSGEDTPLADAFPAARMEAARTFATNRAPETGAPSDVLKRFLGGSAEAKLCADCDGRGKRGLIARRCSSCDGTGFAGA